MTSNSGYYIFELKLPESTPKEVIDWLEFASLDESLIQKIITLIQADISNRNHMISESNLADSTTAGFSISKDDFFDVLYDSDTSYDNIFGKY